MAEAAVSFVLEKLAVSALNKAPELYQVSDLVAPIQRELGLIHALLKDADSKRKTNPLVKEWINQVSEMANRIEDAIDTFLVEIEENCPKGFSFLSKLKRIVKHPFKLNKLGNELKEIVQTLETIYKHRIDLGIEVLGAGSEEKASIPFRPSKLSDIDDSEVVGLHSDKQQIIRHLLDKNILRRTVLSIVGIGGLGKTTLAQKVYKSVELEGQFDCRTWLSISQKFNLTNILRDILSSIKPQMKSSVSLMSDEDLREDLKQSLSRNKYLIFLDDVWTVDLWNQLSTVLPDMGNGSRVLITSRFIDVAKMADCRTKPYDLHYLAEDESLALLFRKTFQEHILPENYPPDLTEVAKQLTKKCGRLPLALVALGGMLSKREPTFPAWQRVEQTLDWHNDEGKKCSQILVMSYDDLPYHLKPCFLYFASFPEDYMISAKHITRMWVAEGFIPNNGEGTLENRAEDFLEQLVRRCLVQVIDKSWNGHCKHCSMHDLLRDLAIHESKENNFFTVFSKEGDNKQLAPSTIMRRASLQYCTPKGYSVHSTNIRSLLCFGGYISNYGGFRLLRVLIVERVDMSRKQVAWKNLLKGLVHLRYLGFRYCKEIIGFQNISFSTLKNLETLDCKKTVINDNYSLWTVPTLRHVIFNYESNVNCPLKWDGIKNLQTLKYVRLVDIPKLECNVNLHTLKIKNYWQHGSVEEGWQRLKILLSRTEHLVILTVRINHGCVPFLTVGTRDLPCHEKIQSLWLSGRWARDMCIPCVEMFPKNLTKLWLKRSHLEEDPMPILERLQSLRILHLLWNSYKGTRLICSTRGFPRLQKLKLEMLRELSKWEIKEGAMPILSNLEISLCDKLHTLPELQNVPSLQELIVLSSSVNLHRRLQSKDHLYKIKHIPSNRISKPRK